MSPTSRVHRASSSTVAIGTATAFLVVAALASFLSDDRIAVGRSWTLRGALIPSAEASAVGSR